MRSAQWIIVRRKAALLPAHVQAAPLLVLKPHTPPWLCCADPRALAVTLCGVHKILYSVTGGVQLTCCRPQRCAQRAACLPGCLLPTLRTIALALREQPGTTAAGIMTPNNQLLTFFAAGYTEYGSSFAPTRSRTSRTRM